MQTYRDNLFRELIIDNFAGVGIEPYIGKPYSEAKQIARLGNAVCPPVATALIRANCADMAVCKQPIKTMAQLNKILAAA